MELIANGSYLHTGPGLWALWLAAAVAAFGLTALALFGIYPPGDVTFTRMVQSVHFPGLDLISEFLSRIGLWPVTALIALAVTVMMAVRHQRLMALFMVLAVAASASAGLLKMLVERPRPSPLQVSVSEQAGGFSFPSGHVLGAVLFWGFVYLASEQLIASPRIRRWVRLVQPGGDRSDGPSAGICRGALAE